GDAGAQSRALQRREAAALQQRAAGREQDPGHDDSDARRHGALVPDRAVRFHGLWNRAAAAATLRGMSTYQTLEVEAQGPVLQIRLSRPEVRNAFNGTVVEELRAAFAAADDDAGARVVVLSGNGKSFSAGADLAWMQEQADLPPARNEQGA